MSYKKLTVKRSNIEGYGLYADEYIQRGEIIMFWVASAYLIPEDEYNIKQANGDQQIIATGARYVGPMFLYTDIGPGKDRYENYINHSFKPNVLYHCGVCFALEDIKPNDELTTDYTYLLAEGDQESFYDTDSGRQVRGANWQDCLKATAEQLVELMQSVPSIPSIQKTKDSINIFIKEDIRDSPISIDSPISSNLSSSSDSIMSS